jgi:hypothetical protein
MYFSAPIPASVGSDRMRHFLISHEATEDTIIS